MSTSTSMLKLMSWLSPVFPTGGFAFSAGLEQAVAAEYVHDHESLADWVSVQIDRGGLWNDAIVLAQAHRNAGSVTEIAALADLAMALCPSQQRLRETCEQGTSFLKAVANWIEDTKTEYVIRSWN